VAKIIIEGLQGRYAFPPLLDVLYKEKKLLGKKGGAGFYRYEKNGRRAGINPMVQTCRKPCAPVASATGLKMKNAEPVERLVYLMVNEAAACLQEGQIASPAHLDMAMIMGTGFPPFRGGLLKYADDKGIPRIVQKLGLLSERFGNRFKPCGLHWSKKHSTMRNPLPNEDGWS